jgi:hypothetical protein
MAVSASVTVGGVVRAVWDDDVEDYVEYAADGVTETLRRDYTPVEVAQKAERVARATMTTNDAAQRERLRVGIPKVREAIAAVDTLATTTSGNTRALATHLGTALRANLALAKILAGVLDTDE